MTRFTKSLLLGTAAGAVDVAPMIAQGLNWYANSSAFMQWVVMGMVITHIDIGISGWLKGLIVAELCAVPIMIIVSMNGIGMIIPIAVSTAILGSVIGYIGDRYLKK